MVSGGAGDKQAPGPRAAAAGGGAAPATAISTPQNAACPFNEYGAHLQGLEPLRVLQAGIRRGGKRHGLLGADPDPVATPMRRFRHVAAWKHAFQPVSSQVMRDGSCGAKLLTGRHQGGPWCGTCRRKVRHYAAQAKHSQPSASPLGLGHALKHLQDAGHHALQACTVQKKGGRKR